MVALSASVSAPISAISLRLNHCSALASITDFLYLPAAQPFTMLALQNLALLACVSLVSAARLTISIPGSHLLPNPSSLPSSTHAVLLGPPGVRYDTQIRRDNTFLFPDVPEASYLLSLHSRDFFFAPIRIDVNKSADGSAETISAWQTFRGNEWSNKGSTYGSGQDSLTIDVRPAGLKEFYQTRGGFNLLGFLKSPMILMALVSVVMIFGLPYLMENSKQNYSQSRFQVRDMRTNTLQWIRRPRLNSRRCKRSLHSWVRQDLRPQCKASIWLDFWLVSRHQTRGPAVMLPQRRSSSISLHNNCLFYVE